MNPIRQMPVIVFDHYQLRTIHKKDYKDMYAYGKDEEVTAFLSWGPFEHPKQAKQAITKIFYPRVRHGLPKGYAIIDLEQDKMIGTIDFHTKRKDVCGAEIGYVIAKAYWNQGIMTKALRHLIPIGFEHLGYDVIYIRHLARNVASQKVILKNHFELIKTEPTIFEKHHIQIADQMLTYELTKERYYANQQSQGNL
jgi:ribosomal-protein-alanine N-acetyltransferase